MGSTLETSIVFTAVIVILSALIMWPFEFVKDSYGYMKECIEDPLMEDDSYSVMTVEEMNTILTGLSENYRMIIGGVKNAFDQ